MFFIERSDVYLVNESRKLESVSSVYEIGEKSHSLLDHHRTAIIIIINKTHFHWDSEITISISIAKMHQRLPKSDKNKKK